MTRSLFCLCALLAIAPSTALIAQSGLSFDDEDLDYYLMSPFEVDVSRDTGYLATNATSGTRLNMELKNLPMAIDVITPEFVEDTGSTDLKEALAYTSGTFFGSYEQSSSGNGRAANQADSTENSPSANAGGTNNLFTNSLTIRGFRTDTQQRNGFRIGGSVPEFGIVLGGLTDAVNIERAEVVKGPAALLYGVNVLSGVVNIIPKRPLPVQKQSASLSFGSYDFYRATIDVTGPVSVLDDKMPGKLNYRVAGSFQSGGDWTDWREKEVRYGVAQLEYKTEKIRFLAEIQAGRERLEGIGAQYIYDNLSNANASGSNFVYIERENAFRNEYFEQYNWLQDGAELEARGFPGFHEYGDDFRVSGPDTWFQRDEVNLMGDLEISPIENLFIKVAGYHTTLNADEFNINILSANNQDYDVLIHKTNPNRTNPVEVDKDLVTLFENPSENPPVGGLRELEDHKMVRYWWYQIPTDTTSDQLRLEATYELETPFLFNQKARHNFLVGRNDIRDEVDHVTGRADADEVTKMPNRQDVYLQRSIYDDSIFAYNGEPLSYPTDIDKRELFVNRGTSSDLISGSNQQNTTIWQTGHYAIYQGHFLEDKLYAMIGYRHDRLQVKEVEKGIIVQEEQKMIGFVPVSFQVIQPGFTEEPFRVEYNFEDAQKHESLTYALRYAFNDNWSIYALSSEGVFPNTGQRDGNNNPIKAETTQSYEIGLKFELFDRKISGGISVFQINRENAVWYWSQAPAPLNYANNKDAATIRTNDFDPVMAEIARILDDPSLPIYKKVLSYGVHREYFNEDEWFPKLADGETTRWTDDNGQPYPGIVLVDLGGDPKIFLDYNKLDETGPPLAPEGVTYRDVIEAAWTDLMAGRDDLAPLFRTQLDAGNNPSNNVGTNVLFEDKAQGYELSLVVTPLTNLQFLFNYAHIEREVDGAFIITPPNLFEPSDLEDDFDRIAAQYPDIESRLTDALKAQVADALNSRPIGTEYDRWVSGLGRESFDDPTDAATINGGGIDGESLYFGPEDSASLWAKYNFSEGNLDGLSLATGVIYTGPARTAVTVGGSNLRENRYPTPDTEERYRVDAGIYYKFETGDIDWRLALNIYNLLDDTYGLTEVEYIDDFNNRVEKRRTERHYEPRTYRVSISASF